MSKKSSSDPLLCLLEMLLQADGDSVSIDAVASRSGASEGEILAYADWLVFLGVVKEKLRGRLSVLHTENSGLILKSLNEYRRAGRPLLDDQHHHGNAKIWVRVLHELEARRRHLALDNPIREAMVAMAIIVGTHSEERHVLLEHAHGPQWERFKFVGGKREQSESFAIEVAQRELAEEIQDDIGTVLKLDRSPIVHGYDYVEVSFTRGALTHYTTAVFGVSRYTTQHLNYSRSSGRKLIWMPVAEYFRRVEDTPDLFSPVSSLRPVAKHINGTQVLYPMQAKDRRRVLSTK